MTTPQDGAPDRSERITRAVTGVVVGVVGLGLVVLVVAVVGYQMLVNGWAEQYDTSAPAGTSAPASGPASTPSSTSNPGSSADPTGFSGEGLDLSNEAYRERVGSPEGRAEAALSLPEVEAALEPLVSGEAVDQDAVRSALVAAGFENVQVHGGSTLSSETSTHVAVGVGVPGGCVYGAVGPDGVTLEAGGPIMDGGCLEMPAH